MKGAMSSVLALAIILWMAGCQGDSTNATDSDAPDVRATKQSQAYAALPNVPFDTTTPVVRPRALASWPHDTGAYTQGLVVYHGRLLESTGLNGRSSLREAEEHTGRVLRRTALPDTLFGEGIAVVGGRIYQLTWLAGKGYVYDAAALAKIDSFTYDGEGWGLTTDGTHLIMSNGSSRLRIVDPNGFKTIDSLQVTEAGKPVWMLNALEYVRGEVWANIYRTDLIARIEVKTGRIIGWVDVSKLLTEAERADVAARGGVANGIALDSARNVVLVTGKRWPRLFEFDLRGMPAR